MWCNLEIWPRATDKPPTPTMEDTSSVSTRYSPIVMVTTQSRLIRMGSMTSRAETSCSRRVLRGYLRSSVGGIGEIEHEGLPSVWAGVMSLYDSPAASRSVRCLVTCVATKRHSAKQKTREPHRSRVFCLCFRPWLDAELLFTIFSEGETLSVFL